ncbi:flagellar assembly protein FliW [Bdellovibrio sp. BCCA]|uniref:flagellar assembly protein FliW n=1 Tax=Bdellovibrio sp. BCCA TaxID=3136281 RepID=UPI0030F08854
MKIDSLRFGEIEIDDSSVIHFQNGMIGFPECQKFAIVKPDGEKTFHWLVSCEKSAIAFPLINLRTHFPDLIIGAYGDDAKALGFSPSTPPKISEDMPTWGVVTLPNDLTQMTVNLKAPVVIHGQIGCQCVQKDQSYKIREPIFQKLLDYENFMKNLSKTLK